MSAGDPPAPVLRLSDAPPVGFAETWYEIADPQHFWMRWRFEAWRGQLADLGIALASERRALDIGGGRGALRAQLEASSRWVVDIADLNPDALAACRAGRGELLYYDVFDQLSGRVAAYDAALLFDVIEHIEDPKSFLEVSLNHVRPGGYLFINVPALQCFYSGFDSVQGHLRRYDRASLGRQLAELKLRVLDIRYWGFSLLLLLAARALLQRSSAHESPERVTQRGLMPPNRLAGLMLNGVMKLETSWLRRPPLGTSLLAACQRL